MSDAACTEGREPDVDVERELARTLAEAIEILAGAIAGAVYVYREGFGLPVVAAIGVAIPAAVVASQEGYAAMIWRDGPWAFLAMLAPILGGVAMVVSTLGYRRVRGR